MKGKDLVKEIETDELLEKRKQLKSDIKEVLNDIKQSKKLIKKYEKILKKEEADLEKLKSTEVKDVVIKEDLIQAGVFSALYGSIRNMSLDFDDDDDDDDDDDEV